jgi:hypothetical protein
VADSGNGYHLLYRIDLLNDPAATTLVKNGLVTLAQRFDNQLVKVDESVYNAARIVKAYGSLAAKGKPTQERPHRISKLLRVPKTVIPVTLEQLQALAGGIDPADSFNGRKEYGPNAKQLSVAKTCEPVNSQIPPPASFPAEAQTAPQSVNKDELKRKAGIRIYKNHLEKWEEAGSGYKAVCPFHPDADPSFEVYRESGEWRWKCFPCEAAGEKVSGGDVIAFLQKLREKEEGKPLRFDDALTCISKEIEMPIDLFKTNGNSPPEKFSFDQQ